LDRISESLSSGSKERGRDDDGSRGHRIASIAAAIEVVSWRFVAILLVVVPVAERLNTMLGKEQRETKRQGFKDKRRDYW
jgi:hypothetical protein